MEFKHETNRIYCTDDHSNLIAEITFPLTGPGVYCINHTYVDDCLRGQGVAGQLMRSAVDQIHEQQGRVTATCSYAVSWLAKHPDEV